MQKRTIALITMAFFLFIAFTTSASAFSERLYGTCFQDAGLVYEIDTATNSVIRTISIPDGKKPYTLAVDEYNKLVYVTNYEGNSLSVIDTGNYSVVTIPVGYYPAGVAVSPDSLYVYVVNLGSKTVSVVRASDKTVIKEITNLVDYKIPNEVVFSADRNRAYLCYLNSNIITVIDTDTHEVVPGEQFTLGLEGSGTFSLAISPMGTLWATKYATDKIVVYDLINRVTLRDVQLLNGSNPKGITLNTLGTVGYVINTKNSTIAKIDSLDDYSISYASAVGVIGIAVDFEEDYVYVADNDGGVISKINVSTLSNAGSIPVMNISDIALMRISDKGTLAGKVVSDITGVTTPVVGATVTVGSTGMTAQTSGDGSFLIYDIPPGVYTVYADYDYFETAASYNPVSIEGGRKVTLPNDIVFSNVDCSTGGGVDLDKNGKVDLSDIIYGLQIISGLK